MPQADSDERCRAREFYQPPPGHSRQESPSFGQRDDVRLISGGSPPNGWGTTHGVRSRSHGPAAHTSFGRTAHVSVVAMIDSTGSAIYAALNGLAARQRVIANNVANIETPGFIAGRVSFEDSLRSAIAGGDAGATSVATTRSADPVNQNGNNLSLDNEVVSLTDTDLRYQLMVQAMNQKFGLLRSAIGGGA
jgi:flagellar basal-body rod protein FlgB